MASREVRSPTGGVVLMVQRQSGDAVAAGEEIIFVECMKMEIPVACEYAGRIALMKVKAGDAVSEGQVLAVIET